jgi:hypothetical protein
MTVKLKSSQLHRATTAAAAAAAAEVAIWSVVPSPFPHCAETDSQAIDACFGAGCKKTPSLTESMPVVMNICW